VAPIGPQSGSNSSMDAAKGDRLDVTLEFSGWLSANDDILNTAEYSTDFLNSIQEYGLPVGAMLLLGNQNANGGTFAISCPKMIVEDFAPVDTSAGAYIPISFTMKAYGTTTQGDEITLAML